MESIKQDSDVVRSGFPRTHPGCCEESVLEVRGARFRGSSWETEEVESLNWAIDKNAIFKEKLTWGKLRFILNWDERFRIYSVHLKKH